MDDAEFFSVFCSYRENACGCKSFNSCAVFLDSVRSICLWPHEEILLKSKFSKNSISAEFVALFNTVIVFLCVAGSELGKGDDVWAGEVKSFCHE